MADLVELLHRREAILAGLVVSVLLLFWLARRVRRVAKSERPDEPLSNLAMLIGLGWSSEAVWEITTRLEWPLELRLLLFFVLETLLVLSMIRAKRAMKQLGHPGRSGRTVWIVASAMALVAVGVADSFGEAVLRLVIPLLLVRQWWDGLVGEGPRRREDATSWRWTPRRLGLWLGAIEPGERDVESVNRERLIQQMTMLEFRRQHGAKRLKSWRGGRLARISLAADDDMVTEVSARVQRAHWFEQEQEQSWDWERAQDRAAFAHEHLVSEELEKEQERETGYERAHSLPGETSVGWPESADALIERWEREQRERGVSSAPGSPVVSNEPVSDERERRSAGRVTPERLYAAMVALIEGRAVGWVASAHGVGASTLRRYEKVRRLLVEHGSEHPIDCAAEKVRPDVVEFMRSLLRQEQPAPGAGEQS